MADLGEPVHPVRRDVTGAEELPASQATKIAARHAAISEPAADIGGAARRTALRV